jgi:hypothetical protein
MSLAQESSCERSLNPWPTTVYFVVDRLRAFVPHFDRPQWSGAIRATRVTVYGMSECNGGMR